MTRGTAPSDISGTIRAACGCIADVMRFSPTLVTARVTEPCAAGHPELVAAGVIIHCTPGAVTVIGGRS